MEDIKQMFEELAKGNGSVINQDNTLFMNNLGLYLYTKPVLDQKEVVDLKYLLMCCNIIYNRTDLSTLPIEDGFYDQLLEKYKTYDENFQVGSVVVEFKDMVDRSLGPGKSAAVCPISFDKPIERNEIRQEMYDTIMRKGLPILTRADFGCCPIEFDGSYISKRTHNTEHNHPDLVGTLDKAKFVLMQDAIDAGVANKPETVVFERDFIMKHIHEGLYEPNRVLNMVLELKYDGVSVEADCNLEVQSARTRGDTGVGEASDVTPLFRGYVFKRAKCMIGENPIGVKFEAIMTKSNLYRFNQIRNKNYANCRTAIISLFNAADAYQFRDFITLVPLAIDRNDVPAITTRRDEIEFINRVFSNDGEPLRHCFISGTPTEILYLVKAFWQEAMIARDHLNFMYDGIVVSYTDQDIIDKLGRKNFINKYSIAIKFDQMQKMTIFRGYTYEVGSDGRVTPMIHYDPVEFIGTIHTKSSGYSYNNFLKLRLKYGDYIQVSYINDVMPYVTKVDCEFNRNNTNPIDQFITKCPLCGSDLVYSDSGRSIFCPNNECPGRTIQRMTSMLSKLNIKGFAEASVAALNKSHLYELIDVLRNNFFYFIEKLGQAEGKKFVDSLYELTCNAHYDFQLVGSLGFSSVASKRWKPILEQIALEDLHSMYLNSESPKEFSTKLLSTIKGIGTSTANTIANEYEFFAKDIECIMKFPMIRSYGMTTDDNALQIRFTGVRNKQLSELLCNAGYDADDSSSVGKKTDILLVPFDGFMSSKVSKAGDNCKIIPIAEFINNMELYIPDREVALEIKSIIQSNKS